MPAERGKSSHRQERSLAGWVARSRTRSLGAVVPAALLPTHCDRHLGVWGHQSLWPTRLKILGTRGLRVLVPETAAYPNGKHTARAGNGFQLAPCVTQTFNRLQTDKLGKRELGFGAECLWSVIFVGRAFRHDKTSRPSRGFNPWRLPVGFATRQLESYSPETAPSTIALWRPAQSCPPKHFSKASGKH